MSAGTRRTWWRAAALMVTGGTVAGGWFGFARAEPPRPQQSNVEQTVWTRAAAPGANQWAVAPATAAYFPATLQAVTPAAAVVPPAPVPLVPPLPVTAPPTPPSTPASLAGSAAMPEFKAVPPPEPAKIPATLPTPALPSIPAGPTAPAAPVAVPPPAGIAPPAPPAKSVDPIKPVPPVAPDFSLRPTNTGNSVKPGTPAGGEGPTTPALPQPPAVPAIPVKTEPALAPPARTASRAKPTDGPMVPSEKSVFAIPEPTPAAIKLPTPIKPDTLAPPHGDDPMNLKQSALAAALGGALTFAPPAPAAVPVVPFPVAPAVTVPTVPVKADPVKTTDEKVKDLDKKVDDLIELLKGKKDAQGFPVPADPGVLAEVKKLKDEVASLKAQMDKMEKSTSLKPGTGTTGPADPLAGKGTVRVVNDYPVEIIMAVNNNSYHIAPNTKLDIPIPMGEFSYQLLSAGANLGPTKSVIKEKEVVTLRIK